MRCSAIVVCLIAGVGLCGCAGVNKLINGNPKPTDQSQAVIFEPLSVPPDYTLVPTTPPAQPASAQGQTAAPAGSGDLEAADQSASAQTQGSLLSGSVTDSTGSANPDLSAGEQAFLDAADAAKANPDIRQLLATDSTASEGLSKSLTDELILGNASQQSGGASANSGSAGSQKFTITRVQATPLSGIFN